MASRVYKVGDVLTRTVGGRTELVALPGIDMLHLRTLMVDGNKVRGFHLLPSSLALVASTLAITLPVGTITVVDDAGTLMTNAQVRLTPLRTATVTDAFEAKVEVLDAAGTVLASDAAKSFYPQAWSEDQIQEAVYSAYAAHYLNGGSPFFMRQALTTPRGVVIVMRVSGSQTASGVKLKAIPTAYLRSGQHLTASHAP